MYPVLYSVQKFHQNLMTFHRNMTIFMLVVYRHLGFQILKFSTLIVIILGCIFVQNLVKLEQSNTSMFLIHHLEFKNFIFRQIIFIRVII